MANIRYVNPDSTAGGNGTTNATTGANRAYVSLSAWEAARQASLSDVEECVCETGGTADSTAVTIDGWTTSAANYIYIHPSAGHRHPGYWDAAKYRLTANLNYWEDFVRIEGVQWRTASGTIAIQGNDTGTTTADVRIYNCVFDACAGSGAFGYVVRMDHRKTIMFNNVWNNCGGGALTTVYAIRSNNSNGGIFFYNNTIRGSNSNFDVGVGADNGIWRIRNVAVFNVNGAAFIGGGTITADYLASSDATGDDLGGSHDKISQSFTSTFVNAGSGDLHLQSGDTVLKDAGQDLSSDPDSYGGSIGTPLSLDIDGDSRSAPWSIGVDVVVATASVGTAGGVGAASGVGASIASAAGSASGVGAASGVGRSTATAAGASAGVATVSGVGASTAAAAGSASGTGAASGVGVSTASSAGSAAGIGAASGVGSSIAEATGSASGTATVTGVSDAGASTGTASGQATVIGVGASTAVASGASAAVSTAAAIGAGTAVATGAAAGTASASAVATARVQLAAASLNLRLRAASPTVAVGATVAISSAPFRLRVQTPAILPALPSVPGSHSSLSMGISAGL